MMYGRVPRQPLRADASQGGRGTSDVLGGDKSLALLSAMHHRVHRDIVAGARRRPAHVQKLAIVCRLQLAPRLFCIAVAVLQRLSAAGPALLVYGVPA